MEPVQQAAQQQQQLPDPEQVLAGNVAALKKKQEAADQNPPPMTAAAISQALAMVNPNGKDPQIQIGKAIQTPAYAGYCLQYVDDQQGNQNRQPTAFADYQVHQQAGDIQTSADAPKGARVYFSPDQSNNGMGHIGIANGDGTFTSATDNGIKTFKISDWEAATGQRYIGFSPTKS